MRPSREALVTATLWLLAPLFVAAAVAGAVRSYSVVPFWDMWHGYLDFFLQVRDGHWSEWWALHNEHRIVLARILFWIDLAWFEGTVWFLIAANYLLAAGAFLTFRAILRDRAGTLAGTKPALLAGLFVLICLFSWVQRENFVWGFQSQFFLAQWLPLLAFYLLSQSTVAGPRSARQFLLACLVGVLCLGTMASGVVALPLMVAYALLQRMGWKRTTALALLAVACLTLYFIDYRSPAAHGSVSEIGRQQPARLVQYVLLYLGSPFYRVFGARSLPLGQLFGLAFVVLAAIKAVQCLKRPREHPLELALLAFIAYIGGTALGTGAGRLVLGLTQATSERYTTPALMGWMALLMLFLPSVLRSLGAWQHRIVWPLLILLLAMTMQQAKATRAHRALLFEWQVAGLALELGVRDDQQVRTVFYDIDMALQISRKAAAADLSVFGLPAIRDAGQRIDRPAGALPAAACEGALTQVQVAGRDTRYRRVTGWVAPPAGAGPIAALDIVNAQGVVAGYALAGESTAPRRTAGSRGSIAQDRQPKRAQVFKGYLASDFALAPVTLVPIGGGCSVRVDPPVPPPFQASPAGPSTPSATVHRRNIVANEGWTGSDFARTRAPGWVVVGTHDRGDVDTGSLVLKLRRGDILFYRSGPIGGNQLFRVDDGERYSGALPAAGPWSILVFDSPLLPPEFTLTLTDAGSGWGEWSAVAVQDTP